MVKYSTDQQQPQTRAPTPASWRPGQSGNPKGRPRKGNALTEAVRESAEPHELVAIALELARNGESESTRLQALAWLRDSGYTRPAERHEVAAVAADDDSDLDGLTVEQLRELHEAEVAHERHRLAITGRVLDVE